MPNSVIRVVAVVVFGMVCVAWLSLAALHLFALKRAGSAWTPDARLWLRLNVIWYGLLLLFVVAAAVGVSRPGLVVLVVALTVIRFGQHRIRRRAVEWPPQWIDKA